MLLLITRFFEEVDAKVYKQMKGIVFTEFMDMVESKFGYEMVDSLIEENELPSNGIYTSVGTYQFSEMVTLLVDLSKKTNLEMSQLMYAFGQYLFVTFTKAYGQFFSRAANSFTFLESIDRHIHVEVLKLYPDAQLPTFKTKRLDEYRMEMIYTSERKMFDFAKGLIDATFDYFKENGKVEVQKMLNDGQEVHFLVTILPQTK